MKANELMIGDWVYDTILCGNTKVIEITSNKIKGDIHEQSYPDSGFDPIPLTAEILEKNGFVENDGSTSWKFETNSETLVTIYGVNEYHLSANIRDTHECGKGFRWLLYNYTIFYVHQLQQILRVFRVEKTIEL